jgi:hypothetical protein
VPRGNGPTLVPVGRLFRRADAGGEAHVGTRVQVRSRRRVLGHNHAGGHGLARCLLYAAQQEARPFQLDLCLRVGEADQVRCLRDSRAFADREEDLRALVGLLAARYRLLADLACAFLGALPVLDPDIETDLL